MWKVLESWIDRYFGDEEAVLLSVVVLLALVLMIYLGSILAPFFAAVVIAFLLQGGVNRLVRWHVPARLAVWLMYVFFLGLLVVTFFMLVPLMVRQGTNLVGQVPGMIKSVQQSILLIPEKYPELVSQQDLQTLFTYASHQAGVMAEAVLSFSFTNLTGLMTVFVYLILVPLMVLFLLKDKDHLMDMMASLLPHKRLVMTRIWHEMNQQMANYVRGKALEIVIVAAVSYITFVVLGLDYAVLLAILVGFSVLIPYIGAAVVTIPVLLVGYFQWGWGAEFMWLAVAYGVIQFLDGNVLVPLLFSEAVNLHPLAIILAVLVFGGLWGFWGIFFAIPLATLIKAIYNAWPRPGAAVQGD